MNKDNLSPFNRVLFPLAEARLPEGREYPVCYQVSFDYARELFPRRFCRLGFSIFLSNLDASQLAAISEMATGHASTEPQFMPIDWELARYRVACPDMGNDLRISGNFPYLEEKRAAHFIGELKDILAHGDFFPPKGILAKDPIVVAQRMLDAVQQLYAELPNKDNFTNYSYDKGSFPFSVIYSLYGDEEQRVRDLSKCPNAQQLLVLSQPYTSREEGWKWPYSFDLTLELRPYTGFFFFSVWPERSTGAWLDLGWELGGVADFVRFYAGEVLERLGFLHFPDVTSGEGCGSYTYCNRSSSSHYVTVTIHPSPRSEVKEYDVSSRTWKIAVSAVVGQEDESKAEAMAYGIVRKVRPSNSTLLASSGCWVGTEMEMALELKSLFRLLKENVDRAASGLE